MKKLIFSALCLAGSTASGQFVEFLGSGHDFGTIYEDSGAVEHSFLMVNRGKEAVTVINVQASCGCTTPGWTKDPVGSGDTAVIMARFDPNGRPGPFHKTLHVYTSSGALPMELEIRGMVMPGPSVTVEPDVRPSPYEKFFPYNAKDIGAEDQAFERFISDAVRMIAAHGHVHYAIEAQASHVPTYAYSSNEELARRRAEDTKQAILKAVKRLGADPAAVHFTQIRSSVVGPAYQNDYIENREVYERFQFVRVVPATP